MTTTSGDSCAEKRVGNGPADIAKQTGLHSIGSLDTEYNASISVEGSEHPQREGLADTTVEDGIGPDDAPEVVWDDINEEGQENWASMLGQLGRPMMTSADAMRAMQEHQENETLLSLGALCVTGRAKEKKKVPVKDTGSKKNKRQKPKKKKKDRDTIEESIRRMGISRSNTAPSWHKEVSTRAADLAIPASLHSSAAAVPGQELHQYEGNNIRALSVVHTKDDGSRSPKASATQPRSRSSSPQVRSPPIALPSVISTPSKCQPLLLISGDEETRTINLSRLGGTSETRSQSYEGKQLPSTLEADHTADASGDGVDGSEDVKSDRSAPPIEDRNDENELRTYTNTVGLAGLDATPLIVAEGMISRVGDETRLPSSWLVHPRTHIPGFPYDTDMGERMQGDFSIPMDEDEDELEPSFGVVSNTTFDPSLAYQPQPHSYSHGLNTEQGGLIVEDIETEFVADSAMEDAGMESWEVEATATTEALQPFSWMPPSVFGAFHAIFPNVPSTQMTASVNPALHVLEPPTLSDPYAMGSAIPEGSILQQVASPQDIPSLFVPDGTHTSPSVEGELFKGSEYIVPNLSNTPSSNVSAGQTTSCSFTSPTLSRAGPVPFSPSIPEHIEQYKEENLNLDEEMDPKLGVAASFQHGTSPLRGSNMHKSICLIARSFQRCTQPPPANSSASQTLFLCPFSVDTTAVNHSDPTPASPIERDDNEVDAKESKDNTKDSVWEGVHDEMVDHTLALARRSTKESPLPTDSVTTIRSTPPIPPRVAGSKRKFVEDRGTYCNSINPARKKSKLPRSKKQKIEHGEYSTHKRLGEVKAMHYREIEGTGFPEVIKFATRRGMPVWSSSGSPPRNLLSAEALKRSA